MLEAGFTNDDSWCLNIGWKSSFQFDILWMFLCCRKEVSVLMTGYFLQLQSRLLNMHGISTVVWRFPKQHGKTKCISYVCWYCCVLRLKNKGATSIIAAYLQTSYQCMESLQYFCDLSGGRVELAFFYWLFFIV